MADCSRFVVLGNPVTDALRGSSVYVALDNISFRARGATLHHFESSVVRHNAGGYGVYGLESAIPNVGEGSIRPKPLPHLLLSCHRKKLLSDTAHSLCAGLLLPVTPYPSLSILAVHSTACANACHHGDDGVYA